VANGVALKVTVDIDSTGFDKVTAGQAAALNEDLNMPGSIPTIDWRKAAVTQLADVVATGSDRRART
jgi:hypothetical protein